VRAVPLQICLPLIRTYEGDGGQHEAVPTRDPVGNWEIGWSHKIANQADPLAEFPDPITREQADALAVADLDLAAAAVLRVVGDGPLADLTDAQYAALIDFTYNVGEDNFAKSTLARMVVGGNLLAAGREFGRWTYGHGEDGTLVELPGLVRRRAAETAIWRA
jgi:lysozyme